MDISKELLERLLNEDYEFKRLTICIVIMMKRLLKWTGRFI